VRPSNEGRVADWGNWIVKALSKDMENLKTKNPGLTGGYSQKTWSQNSSKVLLRVKVGKYTPKSRAEQTLAR
jgi:hypothetical protein